MTITVVLTCEAKPGKEAELKKSLMNLITPTRSEKECIEYRLHQDMQNPAKFVFYENWQSKAGIDAHFQMPYITDLLARVNDLLARPFEMITAEELKN